MEMLLFLPHLASPLPSQDLDRVPHSLLLPGQEMPRTGYGAGGMPLAFSRRRTFLSPLNDCGLSYLRFHILASTVYPYPLQKKKVVMDNLDFRFCKDGASPSPTGFKCVFQELILKSKITEMVKVLWGFGS